MDWEQTVKFLARWHAGALPPMPQGERTEMRDQNGVVVAMYYDEGGISAQVMELMRRPGGREELRCLMSRGWNGRIQHLYAVCRLHDNLPASDLLFNIRKVMQCMEANGLPVVIHTDDRHLATMGRLARALTLPPEAGIDLRLAVACYNRLTEINPALYNGDYMGMPWDQLNESFQRVGQAASQAGRAIAEIASGMESVMSVAKRTTKEPSINKPYRRKLEF